MTAPSGSTHKERRATRRQGSNGQGNSTPFPRTPPHNLDAERSLIGGLCLDHDASVRALSDICSAGDFYSPNHRKIFEAIVSLAEDGIPVDHVALLDRVTSRGDLEAAGGPEYLEALDKIVPASGNLTYYAKIIHEKARARRLIEAAADIARLGYEQHGDVSDFIAEAERRVRTVVEDTQAKRRLTISTYALPLTPGSLRAQPIARQFMLRDCSGSGRFVQGKVGLFVATGGTGKTWALAQLVVAVATGTGWFGTDGWWPERASRVLAIFGEEEQEDVLRTLHFAVRANAIENEFDLKELSRNVTVLGMAGRDVSLTSEGGLATEFAAEIASTLREAAEAGKPYTLVVLDPLSRFAGPDVETDNYAATRFIQVLESFASLPHGKPSVVTAHHTAKWKTDDRNESADIARGASAIKDGARWMARLDQVERSRDSADLLTLKIVKANGIPPQRTPLILCRSQDHEGALRLASADEVSSNEKLSELVRSKVQELADYEERVIEVLASLTPLQEMSANKIVEFCGNRPATLDAIRSLLKTKRIVQGKKHLKLPPKQPDLFTGTTPGTSSGTTGQRGPVLPGSVPPLSGGFMPEGDGGNQQDPPPALVPVRTEGNGEPGNGAGSGIGISTTSRAEEE